MPRYAKITPPIVPAPRRVHWHKGDLQLPGALAIVANLKNLKGLDFILENFKKEVEEELGIEVFLLSDFYEYKGLALRLCFDAVRLRDNEAYRITISEEGILAEMSTVEGAANALRTLSQIFFFSGRTLPFCYITDWPDSTQRGVLLQINPQKPPAEEDFIKFINLAAFLKINRIRVLWPLNRDIPVTPWLQRSLIHYAQNLFVDMQFCKNEFEAMDDFDRYLSLNEQPSFTGFTSLPLDLSILQTEEDFPYSMNLLLNLESKESFNLLTVFKYRLLPYIASTLWNYEGREKSDILLWLDDIVFLEMSGSAARLCSDLEEIFVKNREKNLPSEEQLLYRVFNPEALNLDELHFEAAGLQEFLSDVMREQAQLDYLEFKGKNGKFFLQEFELTLNAFVLALKFFLKDFSPEVDVLQSEEISLEQQLQGLLQLYNEIKDKSL